MDYILHNLFYMLITHGLKIYGESYSTVISIDTDTELNTTTKLALRYGFHKTEECPSYKISYLCIQKCLDLNFDVAYADKNCKCTCYIKKDKAQYSLKNNSTRTKWKLGAPTTSIPAWANQKKSDENGKDKDKNKGSHEEQDGGSSEINILITGDPETDKRSVTKMNNPDKTSKQSITTTNTKPSDTTTVISTTTSGTTKKVSSVTSSVTTSTEHHSTMSTTTASTSKSVSTNRSR